MDYEKLINLFNQYGEITRVEEQIIKIYFTPLKVKKKQILVERSTPCNELFFLNSGILRSFYINKNGKEVTRMIAWENRFLTNIVSFRNFDANNETIECIMDADILSVKKKDFEKILSINMNLKSIYTDILEIYTALNIQRFEALNTYDLSEKFLHLKEHFPHHLIKLLNDNILASLMGISREYLVKNKHFLYV
ncbi:Crp/Fnr family transcriptional regulator [Riemerella columbina]|uniref:Crp/Fnr family transcriptional regulator n=1 Tax=Riemerella columbina TaxID=103810 RepID=UPI00039E560A|nr:cyclic nucleotide-binding domain-containing protein [Riemerella columbina]